MDRRRWKSLGIKLAACTLAGAVLTVAVAWGLALWVTGASGSESADGPLRWSVRVPKDWPAAPQTRHVFELFGRRILDEGFSNKVEGIIAFARRHDAGWPVMALRSHERTRFTGQWDAQHTHNAIVVPHTWAHQAGDEGFLPTHPLWPGFALDTAFYATLTFLLWSAPAFLRRRTRKRRGRCPACGYGLRGGPGGACPECGS